MLPSGTLDRETTGPLPSENEHIVFCAEFEHENCLAIPTSPNTVDISNVHLKLLIIAFLPHIEGRDSYYVLYGIA